MTIVYIKGQGKYKSKVKKSLTRSDLVEGDHYIEGVNSLHESALYWKSGRITLREFKKAIGADTIWKYRLKFYENVEDLVVKQQIDLTIEDKQLIEEYQNEKGF